MPIYDVTIDGVDYEVESQSELTDAQAYQYAKKQASQEPKKPEPPPPPPSTLDSAADSVKRFGSSFLETINPMNAIRGLESAIPFTEANQQAVAARLKAQEANPFTAAVANSPLGQFGGVHAGERMATGDIAGGLGEAAGDITLAAAPVPLEAAAVRFPGAARIVSKATDLAESHPILSGAALGYVEGGPTGALIGAAGGGTYGKLKKLAGLVGPKTAERMPSGAREIEAPTSSGPVRLQPPREPSTTPREFGPEPVDIPNPLSDVDPHMPNTSAGAASREGLSEGAIRFSDPLADVDQYMPNTSAPRGQGFGPEPLPFEDPLASVDRYMPNTSAPKSFDEIDLTSELAPDAPAPSVARERAQERFGRTFVDEGATTPTGREVLPESLPEAAEATSVPELDIPQTKSRNPLSQLDSRMSENDVQTLVQLVTENPGMSMDEAVQELIKQRGQRSQMYRNQAGLSKSEQSALDRDY